MSSAAGAVARWIRPFLTVAVVACAGLVVPLHVGSAPVTLLADEGNPLAGQAFYVDPISKAMIAARNANPPSAELTAVANTPQAYWLDQAFPAGTVGGTVARIAGAAQAAGAMPILALYAIPHRDCGSFAAGGFGSADGYRAVDRQHRRRPGLLARGDHPRTGRAGDGRLPVRPISARSAST